MSRKRRTPKGADKSITTKYPPPEVTYKNGGKTAQLARGETEVRVTLHESASLGAISMYSGQHASIVLSLEDFDELIAQYDALESRA